MNTGHDGVFVVVDIPNGVSIEFGIDSMTYETGAKFKGVGMIPAGLHLIYYSTGMGSRQGFFVELNKGSFEVRSWDRSDEQILPICSLSDESKQSLHESVNRGELNENIGSYPFSQYQIWLNLTSYINRRVLNRCDADINTLLFPGDSQDIEELNRKLAKENISHTLTPYFPGNVRVARYCDIKRYEVKLRDHITSKGRRDQRSHLLTRMYMDKTDLLELIIEKYYSGVSEDLLGELQLSFILFICLYSHPSLEQWKALIQLICTSERYLKQNPVFTNGFIRVLYEQLNFAPTDFFEDELSKDNFLRPCLSDLFSALNDVTNDSPIYEHKKRFVHFVGNRFNIKENLFDQESLSLDRGIERYVRNGQFNIRDLPASNMDGDDMPVIVGYTDDSVGMVTQSSGVASEAIQMDTVEYEPVDTETKVLDDWKKYSWRYPLLYESMIGSSSNEDCSMTAARIIEQFGMILTQDTSNSDVTNKEFDKSRLMLISLVNEAKMFIEQEIGGASA